MARVLILIGLILALAGAARAGMDEGLAAYNRGDFGAARAAWAPLAEAGDREAQYFLGHL